MSAITYAAALEALREIGADPRQNSHGTRARCPVHGGDNRNLSLDPADDGGFKAYCWSTCAGGPRFHADLLDRLRDRMPMPPASPTAKRGGSSGQSGERVATYLYVPYGEEVPRWRKSRFRTATGGKFFPWERRSDIGGGTWIPELNGQPVEELPLYGWQNLAREGVVYWVEGEKSVHRAAEADIVAVCAAIGGSEKHLPNDLSPLKGRDVVIVADRDGPGTKHARAVQAALQGIAASVRLAASRTTGEGDDLVEHLDAGHSIEELDFGPVSSEEPWEEPFPLRELPEPVDLSGLPTLIRDVVTEVSRQAQAPAELSLNAALGTLAAATRGVFDVVVHDGWNAGPTTLYGLAVASSGERKDGATAPVVAALRACERALSATERTKAYEARAAVNSLTEKAREAEKAGNMLEAAQLALQAEQRAPRDPLSLILADTTTEALGRHMTTQRGTAALFTTEGTAFSTVAGAYSDRPNMGLLNNAYDGAAYTDARISRDRIDVERPILIWTAAVQPEVLEGYASRDTEGSGFLARFLYWMPETMVGTRLGPDHFADSAVMASWAAAIMRLHEESWKLYKAATGDPLQREEPTRLFLSAGARATLTEYARQLERRKGDGGDLSGLGGWIEKHPARIARIAALFALLDNPTTRAVGEVHLGQAMSLAGQAISHGRATLGLLRGNGGAGEEEAALKVLAKAYAGEPVPTRDVYMALRGQAWVQDVDTVRGALTRLQTAGWVRRVEHKPDRGRPSERWDLHPKGRKDGTRAKVAEVEGSSHPEPANQQEHHTEDSETSATFATIAPVPGTNPFLTLPLTNLESLPGGGTRAKVAEVQTQEPGESPREVALDDLGQPSESLLDMITTCVWCDRQAMTSPCRECEREAAS